MEPLLRTRGSGYKFWKPTSDPLKRESFPFEVEVRGKSKRYDTPEDWARCRIKMAVWPKSDKIFGGEWRYTIQVTLVNRKTGEDIKILHSVDSVTSYVKELAIRMAANAGVVAREQMARMGIHRNNLTEETK